MAEVMFETKVTQSVCFFSLAHTIEDPSKLVQWKCNSRHWRHVRKWRELHPERRLDTTLCR